MNPARSTGPALAPALSGEGEILTQPWLFRVASDDFREREDDIIWRARWGGNWLFVYQLIEPVPGGLEAWTDAVLDANSLEQVFSAPPSNY